MCILEWSIQPQMSNNVEDLSKWFPHYYIKIY